MKDKDESKIDAFDRSDDLDTSTLWCPCRASFRWSGGDDRLNGWIDEHFPHTYPEHKKLERVKERSQACGEFLEWLLGPERYELGEYHRHDGSCYAHAHPTEEDYDCTDDDCLVCTTSTEFLFPAPRPLPSKLLAEFFQISEDKLEDERRRMLDAERKRR